MNRKEQIVEKLKENGCRITKQRRMLIDIILENDCSSCKEIFYKASRADEKIGVATVYRMINALEEIGAISRKNMYKVECPEECRQEGGCIITLDDDTTYHLTDQNWNRVVQERLFRRMPGIFLQKHSRSMKSVQQKRQQRQRS